MSQYISLVEPMMSERSTDSGGLGRSVSRPEKAEHVRDDVCFWSGEGELQKIKDRLDEDPSLALFANQEGRT